MKLDKWFVSDADGNAIVTTQIRNTKTSHIHVVGEGYGREGFDDGAVIRTSRVADFRENEVETASGSIYELGVEHPDYTEACEAYQDGIPVLTKWDFIGGDREKGFIMHAIELRREPDGKYDPDETERMTYSVKGKIVAQRGNYVTLDNGLEYFVLWSCGLYVNSYAADPSLHYRGLILGEDFQPFMLHPCARPVLFPEEAKGSDDSGAPEGAIPVDDPENPFKPIET